MIKKEFVILFGLILFISNVHALDISNQQKIDFGHVLIVKSISLEPTNITPGDTGVLKIVIENYANFKLYDVRFDLNLSDKFGFLDDISKRKIFQMESGGIKELEYNIIVLPDTKDGIYRSNYKVRYLNHLGNERNESDIFDIIIRGEPKIFGYVSETGVYKENNIGDITIKLVNNDLANIKFLTVTLENSEDYEIISNNKEYIGELDSDDFESINFRLKINKKDGIIKLPLLINYKDSLNKDYSQNMELDLPIRTAKELGKNTNGTFEILLILLLILIIGYYFYKRYKHKKRVEKKF